jgi:hypothetical protein
MPRVYSAIRQFSSNVMKRPCTVFQSSSFPEFKLIHQFLQKGPDLLELEQKNKREEIRELELKSAHAANLFSKPTSAEETGPDFLFCCFIEVTYDCSEVC